MDTDILSIPVPPPISVDVPDSAIPTFHAVVPADFKGCGHIYAPFVSGMRKLRPDVASFLFIHADHSCYRCKGSGVTQWRNAGYSARLCRCTRQKIAEELAVADTVKALNTAYQNKSGPIETNPELFEAYPGQLEDEKGPPAETEQSTPLHAEV